MKPVATDEDKGTLIWRSKVPDEAKPVPIYLDGPLMSDWLGVISWVGTEDLELVFYDQDGTPREWLWWESVEIAFDQARDIAGIERTAWIPCARQVRDDETLRWDDLTEMRSL